MLLIVVLIACSSSDIKEVKAESYSPISLHLPSGGHGLNQLLDATIAKDNDTGVNYIVIYALTNRGVTTTITPRLKSDGTLFISK